MGQSETERAKHPAKVLTVTVDAVLDHPSAVILRPVPDSLIEEGPDGLEGPDSPRARKVQSARDGRTLGPSDPFFGPLRTYARTLITTRRFCARPSRVLFGAIGLSSP